MAGSATTPVSPADAIFLSASSPGMAATEGGRDMTPLQKHVAFFDRNNDGIIYPWEMFQGFRAIGAGVALSTGAALFINISLGLKTRPGKWFSPFFPIYISNIHKGKHGSDTGVYDEEGQFIPARFEEMFNKYAQTHGNALTSNELMQMVKDNRDPSDYSGWFAAFLEWKILYSFCKDKDGLLTKETIQAVYDGSLFLKMEKERAFEKGNASQKKMI